MNASAMTAILCGAVTMAAGRSVPGLNLQFSHTAAEDGQWSEELQDALDHETIYVRVRMTIPDDMYAISGARYNIVSEQSHWDVHGDQSVSLLPGKGSATDARLPGFDFGGQTQAVYENANQLRLDAHGDITDLPVAGISTAQNSPVELGTRINTSKTATVYKFAVNLGNAGGAPHSIRLLIADGVTVGSTNQITAFRAYADSTVLAGTSIPGATGDAGTIWVNIPAPGHTLWIVSGAALLRRRR